jgi:hypothetical protein
MISLALYVIAFLFLAWVGVWALAISLRILQEIVILFLPKNGQG